MSTDRNNNGVDPRAIELFRSTVRDAATIMERARCLGLIRQACEAAAIGAAESPEMVQLVSKLHRTMHMLLVHPEVTAKHPMPAREQRTSAHADPVLLDKLVTVLAEALSVRRGMVLDDAVIIERSRNAAVYIAELLDAENDTTQPCVQVTVRDEPDAATGSN